MKAINNNIATLKASLAATPTTNILVKKDVIIVGKDAKIATKIPDIATRETIIDNLNANISQLQLSMNVNKVDRNFFINRKEKFQEQLSRKIKNLIKLKDHINLYFLELKKLEANVNLYENILDPIEK